MDQQEKTQEAAGTQQEMSKEQALKILDQAIAMLKASRQDHLILAQALRVLSH